MGVPLKSIAKRWMKEPGFKKGWRPRARRVIGVRYEGVCQQHRLYFLPEPQRHGWFMPGFGPERTTVARAGRASITLRYMA
jgi:hypothetical protein